MSPKLKLAVITAAITVAGAGTAAAIIYGGKAEQPVEAPDPLAHASGAEIYAALCSSCHGESGRGDGPAGVHLEPPPRDLSSGVIKFAEVSAGALPRDEDLARTIRRGLAGTAMPGFAHLDDRQVDAVVQHVKSFSERFAQEEPGAPVAMTPDPFGEATAAAIAEGRLVYHDVAICQSCHPSYMTAAEQVRVRLDANRPEPDLRIDGWRAMPQDSDYGYQITPPDFTSVTLKRAESAEDLFHSVAAGLGGTPMPAWTGVLTDRQIWAVAYYLRSLSAMSDEEASDLRARVEASYRELGDDAG